MSSPFVAVLVTAHALKCFEENIAEKFWTLVNQPVPLCLVPCNYHSVNGHLLFRLLSFFLPEL